MEGNSQETVGELVPVDPGPVTLFGDNDPDQIVQHAARVAGSLKKVIRDQRLYVTISGNDHVRVEGWTLLGTMLGVYPILAWTRPLEDGWEAKVEARTMAGNVVGAAEAQCTRTESRWRDADDYALRSMAQTRATSKALRQPLGFVITLAGFQETPAEEMPQAARRVSAAQADRDEIKRLISELGEADPGVDWAARARQIAGGNPGTLTPSQADDVIRAFREALQAIEERAGSGFEPPAGVQTAIPPEE